MTERRKVMRYQSRDDARKDIEALAAQGQGVMSCLIIGPSELLTLALRAARGEQYANSLFGCVTDVLEFYEALKPARGTMCLLCSTRLHCDAMPRAVAVVHPYIDAPTDATASGICPACVGRHDRTRLREAVSKRCAKFWNADARIIELHKPGHA